MKHTEQKEIWVFVDGRNERHFTLSLNVLAKARELAASVSGTTVALLMGSTLGTARGKRGASFPASAAVKRCVSGGADYVHLFDNPLLVVARTDVYAPVIADAVESGGPMLVLFALTDFGRDLAARTARLCNAGLIADCVDLAYREGRVVASCPSWGGEILAKITYTEGYNATGFATVQAHGITPSIAPGTPGTVVTRPLADITVPRKAKLISSALDAGEHKKLEEADVVVVGGAGAGSAEGFAMVRTLASALGGEVG
ncbi:MAG: FAD-binding protein, partial [Deltaproteobacteria bacterium]|nr:FAD-binding protein [Deltaproteobacteria bacterium]